jgi:hypothetical protein
MSSVPATRIDSLAHSSRPSLRLVRTHDPLELYPSLFVAIREAFARRAPGRVHEPTRAVADEGRATGARV